MGQDKPGTTQQDQSLGIQERGACSQLMCLTCWTARVAAVHARLRVVGMYGGACCLADWCIGSVLPYPPVNAFNSHF